MNSFSDTRSVLLATFQEIRLKYVWKDAVTRYTHKFGPKALEKLPYVTADLAVEIAAPITTDITTVDAVRHDNSKFGHMNHTPRNAFFCRLHLMQKELASYRGLFIRKPVQSFAALRSAWNFFAACIMHNIASCQQILEAARVLYQIICNALYSLAGHAPPFKEAVVNWAELRSYLQPVKIAGAVSILSFFVIFPVGLKPSDWMTAGLAVIVTRQDHSGSSFFTSVQRLEGTFVGAFFAIIVIVALHCSSGETGRCDPAHVVPILTVWAGLCCMFKEGVQSGYAAAVAAFTPILLIANPSGTSADDAAVRMFVQTMAISLFLIVDILVLPNTTADLVTDSVAKILVETLRSFRASVTAIRSLVEFFYRRNTVAFEPFSAEDSITGDMHESSTDNKLVGTPLVALTEMLQAASSSARGPTGSSSNNIDGISKDSGSHTRLDSKLPSESEVVFDAELGLAAEVAVSADEIELAEAPDGAAAGHRDHREIALVFDLRECNECVKQAAEGLKKAQGHIKVFKNLLLLVRCLFICLFVLFFLFFVFLTVILLFRCHFISSTESTRARLSPPVSIPVTFYV